MAELHGLVRPVRDLSNHERTQMFALFSEYYDCVDRDRFETDLQDKDEVIVLHDAAGDIQGFSTMKMLSVRVHGRIHHALFSGDTVVSQAHWGQRVLGRVFLRRTIRALRSQPRCTNRPCSMRSRPRSSRGPVTASFATL